MDQAFYEAMIRLARNEDFKKFMGSQMSRGDLLMNQLLSPMVEDNFGHGAAFARGQLAQIKHMGDLIENAQDTFDKMGNQT